MEPMRGLIKRFQTLTLLPDWVLVQQAKLGEKEAFGKLYEKYLDRLYRYCFFRVGNNRELAEDLVQSTFVKAWEKLDTFGKGLPALRQGSFQAWLYTIARNSIVDYIRTSRQHEQLDETVMDEKGHVEEEVLQKLEGEDMMRKIQTLTEEQQEVIFLRFVNDLSYKEIAETLGKKEDAIRALQYRGLQELRRRVANDRE